MIIGIQRGDHVYNLEYDTHTAVKAKCPWAQSPGRFRPERGLGALVPISKQSAGVDQTSLLPPNFPSHPLIVLLVFLRQPAPVDYIGPV